MKKTSCIVISFLVLTIWCKAQTFTASLKNNCGVSETANELFNNPQNTTHELFVIKADDFEGKDMIDSLFRQAQTVIPKDELATKIWQLASKQLKGESGMLSTETSNWFPTYTKFYGKSVAIVRWNTENKQWDILLDRPSWLKTTSSVKIFCY